MGAGLDPHGQPGLGARLNAALGVPVIGVAKAVFPTFSKSRSQVLRVTHRVRRRNANTPADWRLAETALRTGAHSSEQRSDRYAISPLKSGSSKPKENSASRSTSISRARARQST